jgi:hypothetical protein
LSHASKLQKFDQESAQTLTTPSHHSIPVNFDYSSVQLPQKQISLPLHTTPPQETSAMFDAEPSKISLAFSVFHLHRKSKILPAKRFMLAFLRHAVHISSSFTILNLT